MISYTRGTPFSWVRMWRWGTKCLLQCFFNFSESVFPVFFPPFSNETSIPVAQQMALWECSCKGKLPLKPWYYPMPPSFFSSLLCFAFLSLKKKNRFGSLQIKFLQSLYSSSERSGRLSTLGTSGSQIQVSGLAEAQGVPSQASPEDQGNPGNAQNTSTSWTTTTIQWYILGLYG